MDQYHYLFKFILIGNVRVGKSSILSQITEKKILEQYDCTIGVEFGSVITEKNKKTIKLQIWDTSGQDAFKQITKCYIKSAVGVFLVFDITNQVSFQDILNWYNDIKDQVSQYAQIVLVGNKFDLDSDRQISTEQAKAFADQYKMQYIEISAKTAYNIEQLFEQTTMEILNKIEMKQIDVNQDSGIKSGQYLLEENTK
ncbi:unnamed protein product [Paramecium sonneborni]|uniref:Uncharacterized protein n=1 Tax=Paramecium sonneborni TaxID=65129 RepID=A0A8S1P281_9CILI|nr:unnamed protein product [Paramecium sonneborni]